MFFALFFVAVNNLRTYTANTNGGNNVTIQLYTSPLLHLQCYLTTPLPIHSVSASRQYTTINLPKQALNIHFKIPTQPISQLWGVKTNIGNHLTKTSCGGGGADTRHMLHHSPVFPSLLTSFWHSILLSRKRKRKKYPAKHLAKFVLPMEPTQSKTLTRMHTHWS